MFQMKPAPNVCQTVARLREIVGIPIDAEQESIGPQAAQNLDAVAGPADGAIDGYLPRLRIERFENRVEQHRSVFAGRSAAAALHGVPRLFGRVAGTLESNHVGLTPRHPPAPALLR